MPREISGGNYCTGKAGEAAESRRVTATLTVANDRVTLSVPEVRSGILGGAAGVLTDEDDADLGTPAWRR
jgi:hypothetical protein